MIFYEKKLKVLNIAKLAAALLKEVPLNTH